MTSEPILLAVVPVRTFYQSTGLTNATSFLFLRDKRLFLVTSRHVFFDKDADHFPDRIEIELHNDPSNIAAVITFSIPLYRNQLSLWRQGKDGTGEIDIAVIEIDQEALPSNVFYQAFTPAHLPGADAEIEIGRPLLIPGFPLGFHDTLHHMPVVRSATLSSSYGYRFQGQGYFLTDARTHRGSSGAPVVMRIQNPDPAQASLPWLLLGVHSGTMDMKSRDLKHDEALSLNLCWYADILMTLSASPKTGKK